MAFEIPDNLMGIVNNILQNPTLLNEIMKLVSKGGISAPTSSDVSDDSAERDTSALASSAGRRVKDGNFTAADTGGNGANNFGSGSKTGGSTTNPASEESEETSLHLPSGHDGEGYDAREDRRRLLAAMKPYVSPQRRKALESLMAASDILDAFKSAKKV